MQTYDLTSRGGDMYQIGAGGTALFPNLQSYEGQIFVTPRIMTAAHETSSSRREAVQMGRHHERIQEHIRGGIRRKVDLVVGASLQVQANPDYELLGLTREQGRALARQFELNFRDWAYDPRCLSDSEGHYDFGGLMHMAFRNMTASDAECAGIIHFDEARRRQYNGRWATHLQIIDPQRIETPPERADDRNVWDGRKLDRYGRMVGFYMRDYHDNTLADYGATFTYYPRETPTGRPQAFHFFEKARAGQHRGLTTLVTVLKHSSMLDRFDDAQLAAAVKEAMFAMYVASNADAAAVADQLNPAPGEDQTPREKFYDRTKIKFGQQRLAVLPPQDEIKFAEGNRSNADPSKFVNQFLRKFAVALNIPFELLAGNYSEANYSSIRAALIDAWRSVEADRGLFFRHVPALVYQVICEEAIARGRVELPAGAPPFAEYRAAYTRCTFTGPPMGWVDPFREAQAMKIMTDNLFVSHQDIIGSLGGDIDEVFGAHGRALELARENGFELPMGTNVQQQGNAGSAHPEDAAKDDSEQSDEDQSDDDETNQDPQRNVNGGE